MYLLNNYDNDCVLQTLFCSKSDAVALPMALYKYVYDYDYDQDCMDCLWELCVVTCVFIL